MSKQVFVANLPTGAPDTMVHALFAKHGDVVGVRMLRVNGCAFVELSSDESADAAIVGLAGADVDGSRLRVEAVGTL